MRLGEVMMGQQRTDGGEKEDTDVNGMILGLLLKILGHNNSMGENDQD